MYSSKHELPYDVTDSEDIKRYAKQLVGKTFSDITVDSSDEYLAGCSSNKGHLGQYIEKNFFLYEPNSSRDADFKEAGLELKVCPVKHLKSGKLRAKERIVLNIIDYMGIVKEVWVSSSLLKKNSRLLIIFYLFEKDEDRLDHKIHLVTLWDYNDKKDLIIIKQDWETIVGKIRDGKAHELSEGDTIFLGACTKGVNSKSLRKQPFSEILAKQRAFSLKQKYVNYIISASSDIEPAIKTIDDFADNRTFEDVILSRLDEYKDMLVVDIHELVGDGLNGRAKNYYASLAARMIGLKKNRIEEFEKGDIKIKTIRLKNNGVPKEDMSFPYFKYIDIVKESWDDSTLIELLDKKFFFMVFQFDDENVLRFKKGMFWNIPYNDLKEVENVWRETINRIMDGKADELPKKSEN
ncbi:MAG: hypothetical protein KAR20_08545, partial [Candidatus Heimdallarchaeota archaeon]|nr:hypothetical protein [Candidatus Heimdallarchaeota archaeon]